MQRNTASTLKQHTIESTIHMDVHTHHTTSQRCTSTVPHGTWVRKDTAQLRMHETLHQIHGTKEIPDMGMRE